MIDGDNNYTQARIFPMCTCIHSATECNTEQVGPQNKRAYILMINVSPKKLPKMSQCIKLYYSRKQFLSAKIKLKELTESLLL